MAKITIGPTSGFGGVAQHIENIAKYSSYDVDLIRIPKTSLAYGGNLHYNVRLKAKKFIFRKGPIRDPSGIYKSKFKLPRKYDIIHLHAHPEWYDLYHIPKKKKAKYVHSVHQVYTREDSRTEEEWLNLKKPLNERMLEICKRADVVISVADWQRNILSDHGIDSIFIPNGVEVKKYETGNPMLFQKKFGLEDEFALWVGRLHAYKRPDLFANLATRNPDKKFVMIGMDITKESLREYLGEEPSSNILCIKKPEFKELVSAYHASRVFVITSKNDTLPTVIFEAMSAKKVVVGANNAGPKEIISEGKDGFLFRPDDIDSLVEATERAWASPQLGENGYKKVKEKYDWPIVVKQIDELYGSLLGS